MYRRIAALALLIASIAVVGIAIARPYGADVEVKFTVLDCEASFLPNAVLDIRHIDKFGTVIGTYQPIANAFGRVDVTIEDTIVDDQIEVTITPVGQDPSGIHRYTYRYDDEQGKEDYVGSIPLHDCGACKDTRNGDRILIKYGACHEED